MSNGTLDPSEELIITSVSFPEGDVCEISFAEKREQSKAAGIMKTIYVDTDEADCTTQLQEMIDLAREIVDAGLRSIRNPPNKVRRIGGKAIPIPEDDDEEDEPEAE